MTGVQTCALPICTGRFSGIVGSGVPVRAQAAVTASGSEIDLAQLSLDAGEGARAVRLTGTGRFQIVDPRLSLVLSGRRIDLVPWRDAVQATIAGEGGQPGGGHGLPMDLDVTLEGLGIGGDEDLSGARLKASLDDGRVHVADLSASGPGGSTLTGMGDFTAGPMAGGVGRLTLAAKTGDRFARFLRSLGLPGMAGILAGSGLEAATDITVAGPVASLRNLRVAVGDRTTVSGAVRFDAAEPGRRARIEAQVAVAGLDLADLAAGAAAFDLARGVDIGLTIDARDVAYGTARGGSIAGRIATDGPALLVERLEVRKLAGAEANLSGRIAPDGTGSIAGRVRAPHAAPLLDLFGPAWIGKLAGFVPATIRDGAVDLAVRVEGGGGPGNAAPGGTVTNLDGSLAGGKLIALTMASGGRLVGFSGRLTSEDAPAWLGLRGGSGKRAAIAVDGRRIADGRLEVGMAAEALGLSAVTEKPLLLGGGDDRLEGGEIEMAAQDVGPFLPLLGLAASGPVPLSLRTVLSRDDDLRIAAAGRVAGAGVSARLSIGPDGAVAGESRVDRLSLPWLISALALNEPAEGGRETVWTTSRFGARPALRFGGTIAVRADDLDLGRGIAGREAAFTVATRPDGISVSDLVAQVAGGRLTASFSLGRQGGLASLIGEGTIDDAAMPELVGPPFASGRLAAKLRFGASGESVAALVANLGGTGEIAVEGFRAEGADPAAPARIAARVLRSDDPLETQRWGVLIPDELGKAPLTAGHVAASGTLIGGALRIAPLRIETEEGTWAGAATLDLKRLGIEARGSLQSTGSPNGWTGPPPAIGLGWSGPFSRPVRTVDHGPLLNSLATVVLARELDRIDTFDLDAAERQRRTSRVEMDRQRRRDAAEAREARLREEAAERARETERARDAERSREERVREAQRAREAERRRQERDEAEHRRQEREGAPGGDGRPPPLDIRPPAQVGSGQTDGG